MSTAEVNPFDLVEVAGEAVLNHFQSLFKVIGRGLAQRMEMQAIDAFRKVFIQIGFDDAQTRTRCTRIV